MRQPNEANKTAMTRPADVTPPSEAKQEANAPFTLFGAGGLKLVADAFGPDDGPPVLLLHGSGQTRHSWYRTAQALGASGCRAIVYDLRGHGESARAPDGVYNPDVHTADLRRVVDRFAEPPVLVGASLGGMAGLLACGEPPRLKARGLALVDIAHRADPEGVKRIRGFMKGTVGGFDSLQDAAEAVARYLPHRKAPKNLSGLMKNLRQGADGRFYWHWDPAIVQNEPPDPKAHQARVERLAPHVEIPVLLVRGAQSELVAREAAEDLGALLPQVEIAEISGARHMVSGDNNDPFAAALLAFVARLLKNETVPA